MSAPKGGGPVSWVRVGALIAATDGSAYRGVVTFVDKEADTVRHADRLTGHEWTLSWYSFSTRYCPETLSDSADCGPAVAIPELAAVVAHDGNPANPWRAHVPRLPGCYLLARTRQEAETLTTTRRWAAACLEEAERVGLTARAPSPPPACAPFHAEPVVAGDWQSCQTPAERAYIGDALGLIIASTGPCAAGHWNTWVAVGSAPWHCRADLLKPPPQNPRIPAA